MEQKIKYQYTYFIYPYVIAEHHYEKYLLKLLKQKHCHVCFFEKEKDFDLYAYFLPKMKEFLFQGFEFGKEKIRKFEAFSQEMQAKLLAKYPSIMFEYDLGKDMQGKTGKEEGIFFHLHHMQLICFQTGICFLVMKTTVEDTKQFRDVLDFNYKFRDLHSEMSHMKQYENIHLQATTFGEVQTLLQVIQELTGKVEDARSFNIDTDRFLTYAYTCLEQEYWKNDEQFDEIAFEFFKYVNFFPSWYKSNFDARHMEILSKWKFIRTGFTKEGMALLTSGIDFHNYTRLPYVYENQYLYTYIFVLYQKIYLKKLEQELYSKKRSKQAQEKLLHFTKELWIAEVTNDDIGSHIYQKARLVSGVEKQYMDLKNKFDIRYKESKLERERKVNDVILVILMISLLLNVINFAVLFTLR